MPTAVKDMNLAGVVPKYNDIQFGGSGTGILPGEVRIGGTAIYDDANRDVIGTKYLLQVHCYVVGYTKAAFSFATAGGIAAAQTAHANRIDTIKAAVMEPGKKLELAGCALGFVSRPTDIMWGPKPISFEINQVGDDLACEFIWTCEFFVACNGHSAYAGDLTWLAFNYDTVWSIDDEGLTTRTITGYAQIPQVRRNDRSVTAVADQMRQNINVVLPNGFRRAGQVFHENAAKDRIDFSITDVQLVGDAYPVGITHASGDFGVSTTGVGFAKWQASMNMNLTTAPGVPLFTAGLVFINAVIGKHNNMKAKIQAQNNVKTAVLPTSMSMRHSLWTRDTQASFTWLLTGSFGSVLNGAGIWEAVGGDYSQWRASMSALWGVRGVSGLASQPNDDLIIDLCAETSSRTIGSTPPTGTTYTQQLPFAFGCTSVPEEASWLGHELSIRVHREEPTTIHYKATSYSPGADLGNTQSSDGKQAQPGAPFTETNKQKQVVEYHGKPRNIIYVQFKGMKTGLPPSMPTIVSVAGLKARLLRSSPFVPQVKFDFLGCCVSYAAGWAVYQVDGYIPEILTQGNPAVQCGNPLPLYGINA